MEEAPDTDLADVVNEEPLTSIFDEEPQGVELVREYSINLSGTLEEYEEHHHSSCEMLTF